MAMTISPEVRDYLDQLVPARDAEVAAMEAYAQEEGFPIVGPACGQLCYQVEIKLGIGLSS